MLLDNRRHLVSRLAVDRFKSNNFARKVRRSGGFAAALLRQSLVANAMEKSITPLKPNPAQEKMLRNLRNPLKMRLFYFQRLPSVWFWGVRVKTAELNRAQVTLPYTWWSQNPFRSTYFAAQAGASELSTGILAMLALEGRPKTSMLVTHLEGDFTKKADQLLTFTCTQGAELQDAIDKAITTREPHAFTATSVGTLPDGTEASLFRITWSFKVKG